MGKSIVLSSCGVIAGELLAVMWLLQIRGELRQEDYTEYYSEESAAGMKAWPPKFKFLVLWGPKAG